MILTENFVNTLPILQKLDEQNFQKAVVFALNSLEGQSNVYLHGKNQNNKDVLLMDQDKATQILDILLQLILFCSKFKTSFYELDVWLQSTSLSEPKTKIFKQKLLIHLDKVREKLHKPIKSSIQNGLKDINWRFQISVSSKTSSVQFEPEIILDFITQKEPVHNFLSCDYANLKNLYQNLNNAYKQHDSSVNKKVRNSIV